MNLSEKLKNFLDNNFLTVVEQIGENADLYGANIYIVGGAVRDLFLNKPIYDIDIVVEGNAIDFCRFLQEKNVGEIIRESQDFCTAKFKFFNSDLELDFASTRTEKYPRSGHLPVVDKIGCGLKEDILRRDFSVNALALKINKLEFGELVDYTGGLEDIENRVLRVLHDESFVDDPTRILRGLRFCHKLGFKLDNHTKLLQENYLADFDNNDICYERIKQVSKLAFNLNSFELFEDFVTNRLFKLLGNNIFDIDVQKFYLSVNENKKYLSAENIWRVYFALFVSINDVSKFNLSSKEIELVESLNKFLLDKKSLKTNMEIYTYFKDKPLESIVAFSAFDENNYAKKYLDELKNIKPILAGQDLINLGFSQGKIIGEILNNLLEKKLDNKLITKEEEINFVKSFLP